MYQTFDHEFFQGKTNKDSTTKMIRLKEAYEYLLENYDHIVPARKNEANKIVFTKKDIKYNDNRNPVLWNNARYGMSMNEIKELFPSAFAPKKLSAKTPWISEDCLLLNNVQILNLFFDAIFDFRNDALRKVSLNCMDISTIENGKIICNELIKILGVRYGKHKKIMESDLRPDLFLFRLEYGWISGPIKISLVLSAGTNCYNPCVGIIYELSGQISEGSYDVAKEANKL